MLEFRFVDKHEALKILPLSESSLYRLRKDGELIEGIHWQRLGKKVVYNAILIQDYVANKHDPDAHIAAIEEYQRSLLSNQPKKRSVSQFPNKSGKVTIPRTFPA